MSRKRKYWGYIRFENSIFSREIYWHIRIYSWNPSRWDGCRQDLSQSVSFLASFHLLNSRCIPWKGTFLVGRYSNVLHAYRKMFPEATLYKCHVSLPCLFMLDTFRTSSRPDYGWSGVGNVRWDLAGIVGSRDVEEWESGASTILPWEKVKAGWEIDVAFLNMKEARIYIYICIWRR